MLSSTRSYRLLAGALACALALLGCGGNDVAGSGEPRADRALNGAWVDGVQSGGIYVYITELRFNNGSFEWTFDADLQERDVYDTNAGTLTVTVQNQYGSPQRTLLDYSRPYSVVGDTLMWGGSRYVKK